MGTRGLPRQRDPTLIQVLSLYLLLLAFFVILYNMSKVEQFKSGAVAESLNSAFANRGQTTKTPVALASARGRFITDPAFQQRIGELIAAEIPIAEVREVKPGSVLEARVPVDMLFEDDDVAPARLQWIERLAGALADAPPGMRYDVDVMVGIATDIDTDGDTDAQAVAVGSHRTLSLARAGHLASRLVAAGAPSGHVAAGLERGDPKWVRLLFHVRGGRAPSGGAAAQSSGRAAAQSSGRAAVQ